MSVSRDGWFRNKRWNDKVAADFEAKLKRTKRKGQPLRIQACTLAESQPEVALELLTRYFQQPDERIFDGQAHVDRATALLALTRIEDAVSAYEDALKYERVVPGIVTQAYIELPYVVSVHQLTEHYEKARKVLKRHRERLTFPVEHFMWHASAALLADADGDRVEAKENARQALEFASKDKSGFKRHQTIGLVTEKHSEALQKLRAFCDS